MKILIADDDKTVHASYTTYFTKKGYEVLHAYDGEEALSLAQEEIPEVMLLDVMMPKRDGRDICKNLKGSDTTNKIHIIMLTGRGEEFERALGLELGADEYVVKPCGLIHMDRLINNIAKKIGAAPR